MYCLALCLLLPFVLSFDANSTANETASSSALQSFLPTSTSCSVSSDCGLGAVCLPDKAGNNLGHCACPVGRLWGRKTFKEVIQGQDFPFVAACRPVTCTGDQDCWSWPNSVCDLGNTSTCICAPHYEYSGEHTACSTSAGYIAFIVFCCLFGALLLCCTLASCVALCCCLLMQPALVSHGEPIKGNYGGGDCPSGRTKLPGGVERKSVQSGKGGGKLGMKNGQGKLMAQASGKHDGRVLVQPGLTTAGNSLRPASPNADNLTQLSEKNGVFFLNA